MAKSRRQFLIHTSAGLLGAAAATRSMAQQQPPPGAPPAFGTGPAVGPEVSPSTFGEAEKLVQVELSDSERTVVASSWRANMAALYERRTGPRKVSLEPALVPAMHWNPLLPGIKSGPERDQFSRSKSDLAPLPANSDDIAFAPVTQLSRWIELRKITSEQLTRL